jgi:predicted HAD superfamily Cof-like phosphohydrolase
MPRPMTMSGHAESVKATAPAAPRTPMFAITSFREHVHAELIVEVISAVSGEENAATTSAKNITRLTASTTRSTRR